MRIVGLDRLYTSLRYYLPDLTLLADKVQENVPYV